MISGMVYSIPTIGRITIGEIVDDGGSRIPKKNDYFQITSQAQSAGKWVPHPLHETLVAAQMSRGTDKESRSNKKLRDIPVRLMFDSPELSFRENYTAFAKNGRPLCVGNGKDARRVVNGVVESTGCPGSDACSFGQENRCKPYGRLNVQIDGQDDPFSTFIFRTSGVNSIRVLRQKLQAMYGAFNGKLAGVPLSLTIRGRSSRMSFGTAFFVADLVLRDGYSIANTIEEGRAYREELKNAGFNQGWMEKEALKCLKNGRFEESEEDSLEFEEFLLGDDSQPASDQPAPFQKKGHGTVMQFENAGLAALSNVVDELPSVAAPAITRIGASLVDEGDMGGGFL